MKIRVLPDCVANQIAAGEVVGSPASVVKEMTENAVDAGASMVTVNFRADGRELVQVIDDGEGMTPADARLAFDKNAGGKIVWFDPAPGLLYSLYMESGASEAALLDMADLLYDPAQDDAG